MKGLCDQSSPQMGSLSPNEVGRIAQHFRKGKDRKEGKDGEINNSLDSGRPPNSRVVSVFDYYHDIARLISSIFTITKVG